MKIAIHRGIGLRINLNHSFAIKNLDYKQSNKCCSNLFQKKKKKEDEEFDVVKTYRRVISLSAVSMM